MYVSVPDERLPTKEPFASLVEEKKIGRVSGCRYLPSRKSSRKIRLFFYENKSQSFIFIKKPALDEPGSRLMNKIWFCLLSMHPISLEIRAKKVEVSLKNRDQFRGCFYHAPMNSSIGQDNRRRQDNRCRSRMKLCPMIAKPPIQLPLPKVPSVQWDASLPTPLLLLPARRLAGACR